VEEPGGALRRGTGPLAGPQGQQLADLRADDRLVERAAARAVGDAQVDTADAKRRGRALRLRERRRSGPGVLADDLVRHRGQVGVQVAAQHVAQQRAQVVGELGGERVELGVDRQAGDDGALGEMAG
jgi:hypothetical protein